MVAAISALPEDRGLASAWMVVLFKPQGRASTGAFCLMAATARTPPYRNLIERAQSPFAARRFLKNRHAHEHALATPLPCHATPGHALPHLCLGTSCRALAKPCHTITIPCHAMPTPCHAVPGLATPWHAVPRLATPCHALPRPATPLPRPSTPWYALPRRCHAVSRPCHTLATSCHAVHMHRKHARYACAPIVTPMHVPLAPLPRTGTHRAALTRCCACASQRGRQLCAARCGVQQWCPTTFGSTGRRCVIFGVTHRAAHAYDQQPFE